nr:class I adenylate-forming enzyme family protein [Candidatus Sigynarchaeota archaeon]
MDEHVLWRYIKGHAKETPDSVAIISGDEKITYRDLDRLSDGLALELIDLGISRGDVIATFLPPSKEYVYVYVAATKIGAVLLPLDLREKPQEIISKCNELGAKVFVTLREFIGIDIASQVAGYADSLPSVKRFLIARGLPPDAPERFVSMEEVMETHMDGDGRLQKAMMRVSPEDDFLIIYTGGTTGLPKGVVHTQGACIQGELGLIETLGVEEDEDMVMMFHLPPSHVGGSCDILLSTLLAGGTLVILEHLRPKELLELIEKHRVTFFGGVATLFRILFMYEDFDKYDLSSVKIIVAAAEPLPPDLNKEIRRRFPQATLCIGYGLTEAGAGWVGIQRRDDPEEKKLYSVGRPAEGIKVKIVDDEGRELPPGETGEILVKGPPVMKTYVDRERNKEAFTEDGWLRTGDLGYVDEDGYLYLVGRKKEMIKVAGYAVYPARIEEYLEKHPDIRTAAVIGFPHEIYGEAVAAFIVPRGGAALKEEDVIRYCEEGLPDYEVPRKVVFKESLPLSRLGKVEKSQLQKELSP